MPGPGSRPKKKKTKNSNGLGPSGSGSTTASGSGSSSGTVDAYVVEIDNAEGWNLVVSILCEAFELPDLTKRSGLKKVHANFDSIYRKIDNAYQRNIANEKIRGGILGIYTKMCVDAILRNKLFEKGFLDKLIPLLDIDSTRHLALQALVTMTHHGGASIRMEIAKHASILTRLIQSFPDDDKVAELCVTTLAHSVCSVVDGGEIPGNPRIMNTLDMIDIIRTVVDTARKPYRRPRSIIEHAVELVSTSTMHATKAFLAYPPAIDFLVAGMRSKDWICRSACLSGLLRLHRLQAQDDQRFLDPNIFMDACQRGVPDHLSDILIEYGQFKSEIFLTLKASGVFHKAVITCAQDKNLYSLGMKIAPLILVTEFSVADGMFEVEDPRTGKRMFNDMGLPFKMWGDALPICAKAIRARGKSEEVDWADILDIKYFVRNQRIPDAVRLAKKALERNPQQAYYYYVITLSADNVQGLRAAKKGLKCRQMTPFVRFQMMQRAVEHAGDLGIKVLQQEMPDAGEKRWEEGIAFLMSALEDAKTYVEQAPPDNRHMKNVGYWYMLLTVLVKEQLSPDLRELRENIERLKVADQFSEFMGVPPPKTNMRLAQQTVVKHYANAIRDFAIVYQRLDESKQVEKTATPDHGQLEDDLSAWLEDMNMEDGRDTQQKSACGSVESPKVNFEHITLYRCSWCGNPSAVLRRCNGCSKTRYCDSGCQKSHWPEHKKACVP